MWCGLKAMIPGKMFSPKPGSPEASKEPTQSKEKTNTCKKT